MEKFKVGGTRGLEDKRDMLCVCLAETTLFELLRCLVLALLWVPKVVASDGNHPKSHFRARCKAGLASHLLNSIINTAYTNSLLKCLIPSHFSRCVLPWASLRLVTTACDWLD